GRDALGEAALEARPVATAVDLLGYGEVALVDWLSAGIDLPGMSGVALLQAIAASGSAVPVVLIAARDDPATLDLIRRAGPVPHLHKPFSDDDLFDAISRALAT